jgi:hypothetical protein
MITRQLFILINLAGMIFPLLFPHFPPGTARFFVPLLSWPIFIFCLWGLWRGTIRYEDDNNRVWQINAAEKPVQFWWVIGVTTLVGWLFMLATRVGDNIGRSMN